MPTKKQNKPQKNAFFFFMEYYKAREELKGKFFKSFAEVANVAGPEWQKMTPEQRRPFELKKEEQRSEKKEKKYTALGDDIAVVNKLGQEAERMKKEMEQYIEDIVSDGNDYVNQVFYVAHVNVYCYCNSISRYIPAEIAMVRFTLKDGVKLEDCYNVILDPGKMPVGYYLAAMTNMTEGHQIPIPPHENDMRNLSERDIHKSFLNMTEYLRKDLGPHEHLPPVYVDDTNIDLAKDVFKNLNEDYDGDLCNEIKVYSLSYLFFVLRNAAHSKVAPEKAFPFPTIPQAELEKDVYDFVKGISCKFHDVSNDSYPHCALSKCIRKIFIICDHTCYDLNIKLIPGRHIPINANSERLAQRPRQGDWVVVTHNQNRSATTQESRRNGNLAQALPVGGNRISAQALPAGRNGSSAQAISAVRNGSSSQAWPATGNWTFAQASQANGKREISNNTASSSNATANHASGPLRKPQTRSMAMNIRPVQPPNLANDFPALGERPQSIGRGRGRILQQNKKY